MSSDWQIRRRQLGGGIFVGFFIAMVGYLLTNNGWWFVCPYISFLLTWRLIMKKWPFSRKDES